MRTLTAALLLAATALAAQPPAVIGNITVHRHPARFGGWPANNGMWSWGNEILVGFDWAWFRPNRDAHAIDPSKSGENLMARSLDGGETWSIETPAWPRAASQPATCDGGVDFRAPGFALTARTSSVHTGPSRFYYSLDRGHTWLGPCPLPNFGTPGIAARTDYLVNSKHDLTLFLTAAKSNQQEGRVICVRTRDGAKSWTLEGMVGPEPEGNDFAIMPATVRLGPNELFTAVRHRAFIDAYRSLDNGKTWSFAAKPAPDTGRGNPPSLTKLKDGRLALAYGYRAVPYGLRARISKDNGKTWSDEIVLRADAGNWDIGYPRTALRPDGKLVTVYYYNDDQDTERYISATIWDPGR